MFIKKNCFSVNKENEIVEYVVRLFIRQNAEYWYICLIIDNILFCRLLDVAVLLSKAVNSYKVSLECKDHMVEFYSQFGFIREEGQNFMQQRWFD